MRSIKPEMQFQKFECVAVQFEVFLIKIFIHQGNMIDNSKQYKSNQIETIITAQTKMLEARFTFKYALGP